MELFITTETQGQADEYLSMFFKDIIHSLGFVTDRDAGLEDVDNYGTEFRILGIIPTCISQEYLEVLDWKERKQIWRKKKETDIRLWMNYERFIKETPENQRLMFIDIIIKSIRVVQDRSKGDFRGEELISDIFNALQVTQEQLDKLNESNA